MIGANVLKACYQRDSSAGIEGEWKMMFLILEKNVS